MRNYQLIFQLKTHSATFTPKGTTDDIVAYKNASIIQMGYDENVKVRVVFW